MRDLIAVPRSLLLVLTQAALELVAWTEHDLGHATDSTIEYQRAVDAALKLAKEDPCAKT